MLNTSTPNTQRRFILACAISGMLPFKLLMAASTKPAIEIWLSPTCGCCHDWMNHMVKNGFEITAVHNDGNDRARQNLGILAQYGSCHTALINGYAFEGHVPAKDVYRVLKEKPDIVGLAVPGMPIGSPGMDGPEYKGRKDPYEVLAIAKNGRSTIYQRYG